MDPEAIFRGPREMPGCRNSTTTIQPAGSLDYHEADWTGAVVVVLSGLLRLECRSGESASFGEGAVLFLTGLPLRCLTNPGLDPLVLRTIRRDPTTSSPTSPTGPPHGRRTMITIADPARIAGLAETLAGLHTGPMLVLPNAWDAASAQVVERAGFPVVATASAAITAMLGHPDGEGAPWEEMFAANARIAAAVSVPVTMDAEAGYGMDAGDLVRRLLGIGVVGCNLEDSDHMGGGLRDAQVHAAWLADVRAAATAAGVPLVVNARVDVFLPTGAVPEGDRVAEAVRRGRLYRDAGADCVYPIGVSDPAVLAQLVAGIGGPINGNTGPQLPLPVLRAMGVARVSYGPRFYRAALAGFADAIKDLS